MSPTTTTREQITMTLLTADLDEPLPSVDTGEDPDRKAQTTTEGWESSTAKGEYWIQHPRAKQAIDKLVVEEVDNNTVPQSAIDAEWAQGGLCMLAEGKTGSCMALFTATLQDIIDLGHQDKEALPPEPKSLKEAMSSPHWAQWTAAMDKEYNSIVEQQTWELSEVPANVRPLGVKWVFKVKTTTRG